MSKKFRNQYRIASARLRTWDYGWNSAYFVTICTQNRKCSFGEVVDGKMILSKPGKIAHDHWMEIPNHFPFVELGKFIAMPNHIHGILIIDKRDDGRQCPGRNDLNPKSAKMPNSDSESVQTPKLGVSTPAAGGKNPKWKPATLGVIINQYKRICTINARKTDPNFAWQTRFHDIIIRDDRAFQNISKYIINNPSKWAADKFYGK